jgi:hypothetical protein
MNRRTTVGTLIAFFTLSLLNADAYSDWTGVYARVDKVVFEPNETAPERIQIWGAFALADKENRNSYERAQLGYLYYSLTPDKEEICRKEWADLKSIAGSGQIIGFGFRNQHARLRKAKEKASDPDVYPLANGLQKISDRPNDYGPIRELKSLPKEQ